MSAPRYDLSEDEDDDLFGDNPGSDGDDNDDTMRPPSLSRSNRRPPHSSLSGSMGVLYSKRAHPLGALPKHPSLSPDLIAALTHDELYHNQQYQKTHQKVAKLEHTVSEMGIALSTPPVMNDTSLTPSDLFSHVLSGTVGDPPLPPPSAGLVLQPLICPQYLPQSVLWTSEDAKNDPLVGIKANNKSRPPMDWAIHLPNGTGISKSQWLSIHASTWAILRSNLKRLHSTDPHAIDQPRKKRYFKLFFIKEWNAAVAELEAAAPLLTLCANHWKADATLGAVLRDKPLPSQPPSPHSLPPQQSRPSSELSSALASSGPQTQKMTEGSKSKRPHARSPMQWPNKKAKHDGQKGKETSRTGTGHYRASFCFQLNRYAPSGHQKKPTHFRIDVITNDFSTVPDSADLLRAMHNATDCETRKPSNDVAALLDQLDSADPDAPDVDNDDSNENWGHVQFTVGGLTIWSALVDWESVGSTSTAFKLIAATVRTCKVARVLCTARGQSSTTYLADNYLELLFEQLQRCWKDTQSSSASPLTPTAAASGSSDAKPPPSKSKPAPKPKPAPKSKPKAAPSKPKAAPSKSQAGPSNSSGTAPAAPTEPSPTKPSGAKAGPSKTKAGPSKSAKRTEPAATNSPTKPAPKRATRSRAAKAHCSAPMDQDESTSPEASSEG
ncbi:hypothetical protein EDB89DRAFT_2078867 [Lactarius sanguifluus]|nr:hypothetical protein EDB89DRAFT_2078867 [Lactarius sanguifluus]